LLFYMYQLWALHVVIKRQFLYIYSGVLAMESFDRSHMISY